MVVDENEDFESQVYHIQPNYHTVRLGFSKLLVNLVVKYVSAY